MTLFKDVFTGKMVYKSTWFEKRENLALILILLSCIAASLLGIGSNIFSIAIAGLFLWLFFISGWETLCAAYLMLTFWDNRMYLIGSSLPLVTVLKLMLALKTLLSLRDKKIRIGIVDGTLLLMVSIFALISIWLERKFVGVSMLMDVMFALFCANMAAAHEEERLEVFWRKLFYVLFLTAIACIAVGYFEYFFGENVKTVSLFGENYKRFRGVVGVDRFCMLACIGAIYPLYHIKNRLYQVGSILLIIICVLLTISLTALICVAAFVVAYAAMHFKGKNRLWIGLLGLALVAYFIYLWQFGSSISIINSMVLRVKKMISAIGDGNLSRATTGRTDIAGEYLQVFSDANLFNKIFGTGIVNQYFVMDLSYYSHNSFLDIVLYMGIVGIVVFLARFVQSIREISNLQLRQQVILMKLSVVITGLSVSAMTADYWLIFLLI